MDVRGMRHLLLRWFSESKRPLPWRETQDPYAIWVSETMLQQTTVKAAIPYYERFMRRFPTNSSLAAAKEDAVLSLWSGLGYYSRARNLRLAAKHLASEHGGIFPKDPEIARTLPGVGPYTANAVTSIAYGAKVAVVDGNVLRILSRVFAVRDLTRGGAQTRAQSLLSPASPGAWNEAMMELGATLCTPRNPACDRCPLRAHCRGRNRAEHWSARPSSRPSVRTLVDMALVTRAGCILLIRNAEKHLLGGLLELPHGGLPRGPEPGVDLSGRYRRFLRINPRASATFSHTVTRYRIKGRVFRARLLKSGAPPGGAFHPLASLADLPRGGLSRKALGAIGIPLRRDHPSEGNGSRVRA